MVDDSRISGFYKLSIEDRVKKLKEVTGLGDEDLGPLVNPGEVDMNMAPWFRAVYAGPYFERDLLHLLYWSELFPKRMRRPRGLIRKDLQPTLN